MKKDNKKINVKDCLKILIAFCFIICITIILKQILFTTLNNLEVTFSEDDIFYFNILCPLLAITTFLLICKLIMTIYLNIYKLYINKNLKVEQYRRDFKDVLPPILAEALVDKKIDMKNMIMTQILQLKLNGNIEIINNEKIKLVSKDYLQEHEERFLNILFKDTDIISFKEINTLFKTSSNTLQQFMSLIVSNKTNIIHSLNNKEILNTKYNNKNSLIRKISYFAICNFPIFVLLASNFAPKHFSAERLLEVLIIIPIMCILPIIIYNYFLNFTARFLFYMNINFTELAVVSKKSKDSIIVITVFIPIMLNFLTIVPVLASNIYLIILYSLIIILNLFIVLKKPKLALSAKGIVERKKLLEFKKYIQDYSLMKEKELSSVMIWDEYLAYAVAFGIPNKVIDTIYEDWYNIGMLKLTISEMS